MPDQLTPTPEQERARLIVAVILSTAVLIGLFALFFTACKQGKPETTKPPVVRRDTIRPRLQRKVDVAKDTARAAHQRTTTTKQPYENAADYYTALRDSLSK